LNTKHWKEVKSRTNKSKFKKECYCCNEKEKLQLHHKTYKRVGNEKLNDLIWLCQKCHSESHKIKNSGKELWNCAKIYKQRLKRN